MDGLIGGMVRFEGGMAIQECFECHPNVLIFPTFVPNVLIFVHDMFFVATLSVLTKCEIDKSGYW